MQLKPTSVEAQRTSDEKDLTIEKINNLYKLETS